MAFGVFHPDAMNRRAFTGVAGGAFALIPLASLESDEQSRESETSGSTAARVSRVVFFYMNGGPSQIDTFDPKPKLAELDGTEYSGPHRISSGTRVAGALWRSEFQFSPQGQCGTEISELFPGIGRFADDLCVIRSMQTTSSLHAPAMLAMNTGRTQLGAASLGAWVDYGLGTGRSDLPDYVVMLDHRGGPVGGHSNWSTGLLPTAPATMIHSAANPLANLKRSAAVSQDDEARMRQLLMQLNQYRGERVGTSSQLQQRLRSYEQAWKMQTAAPEAVDLAQETQETQQRYGLDQKHTREFGTRCLLARRLLERDVRFVQIYSGGGEQKDTWDSHVGNVERHRRFAGETDGPIAAFLEDLRSTGMWDKTLVIWGGEFGRTPTCEKGSNGRDHNPRGFSMWLAGGGVRGGQTIGATDEIGFEAVENVCSVADLHATILHLLGIDHSALKFYQNGVEVGLTGPEPCRVIREVLS
jgi:hypothetical protein